MKLFSVNNPIIAGNMFKASIYKAGVLTGLLLVFSVLSGLVFAQNIPEKPNPPRLVNDYAGLLTPEQKAHLEQKLVEYDNNTSVQVAVVTMKTLDGAGADEFAIELGRKWGVGNKSTNNGVVLLISMEPQRRKVFIAPGFGLESSLSDYTCKTIVDAEIIPQFKQENYYRGIENGVDAIIEATKGQYAAPEGYGKRGKGSNGGFVIFLVVLLILFFIFVGGRGGGGGGDAMTRRGNRHLNRLPPFIFFPPIGGGGGSGGGWSGGGGGGFGGFGGGGFGGGGAGGSW